jgi:predicted HAD superfamily hydrolase
LLPELERTGISLVSFDVFDTVVHRRTHPDAIVWGVAQWLAREMPCFRGPNQLDTLEGRHRAYVRLIHAKAALGLDLDLSLDELVLPWVRECAGGAFEGDESLARKLAEVESAYETASCFCNPTFLALATELKKRGIRLVYTSDMYLGAKYIDRILDACGYVGVFDGGYVSGDLSLLKRTGRLFDAVLTTEGLNGHELFHIGDNELSDGVRPAEKGIRALVHKERRLVSRHRRMAYDYQRAKVERTWLGMLVAQFAEAGLDERGTPEEAYGRRVLGPIFTSFIHRLLERCREENIGKVFFVAREGYALKLLFDQLVPQVFKDGEQTPVGLYLGVSRLTTFLAAMRGFSLREIAASFNNTRHYSICNLFAPLRIGDDVLLRIARKHGFEDINEPLPPFFMQWPPLFRLLEDSEIQSIIRSKSAETKQKLELYLEELGFFDHDRVAVIDVGWSGQIQDNLYSVIKDRADCPQIFGIYLGTTLAAHWRKTPANWMEWTLTDSCHLGWSGKTAFEFVQGLEAVVRSPHGTVVGYEEDGFGIRPLFKADNDPSRRAELEDDPMLALFQQGIMDYGRLYSQAVAMFKVNSADTLPYARMMLDRMIRFPRLEEARWFLHISNVSDLGSSDIYKLGVYEDIPFWQLRRLHEVLKRSFWRYGVVALRDNWLFQWLFAVAAVLWTIPPKHQRLNPGIVFGQCDTVLEERERPDLKRSRDTKLLDVIEQSYRAQLQEGKRRGRVVCLNDHTFPLSFLEVFRSYTAFKAACLMCRLTGRHVPYQDGISIWGWLGRAAAQSGTLKKALQTIRLASCGSSPRSVSVQSSGRRPEAS